jgi:hypothetical protein
VVDCGFGTIAARGNSLIRSFPSVRLIGIERAVFLKYELDHGDDRRQKGALQDLSRSYRHGETLSSEQRNAFESTICGLVLRGKQDPKVVRWCLNALALLGRREYSSRYVELALKQYEENPEIVAAAVAALSRMFGGKVDEVAVLGSVDPSIRILAALQYVHPRQLELGKFRIDVDHADDEVLKLALITIGLNRDIEHLFHPKSRNGEFVKKLGQHGNRIVVQYSAWAVLENKKLSISDLGVPLGDIGSLPANVQSKVLQVIAEMESDPIKRHKFVSDGPFYASTEAREGLAKGLRSEYYDGLADVTLDWFDQETHQPVRAILAEHFARHANDCPPYEDKALEIMESAPELARQLLVGAEKSQLYGKLKVAQGREGMDDLFAGVGGSGLTDLMNGARPIGKKGMRMIRKVLLLSASPVDQSRLRIDEEYRDLDEKLKLVRDPQHDVQIKLSLAVRTDQIQDAILNEKPEILHFSGHGDTGKLIFENKMGETAEVSATAIAELVELNKDCIRCVVLSACYSDVVGKMIKPHVDCVIGCTGSIADSAAISFARGFYRGIANGRAFHDAYRLAVNEIKVSGMEKEALKYVCLV